jgi:hypothetical protein
MSCTSDMRLLAGILFMAPVEVATFSLRDPAMSDLVQRQAAAHAALRDHVARFVFAVGHAVGTAPGPTFTNGGPFGPFRSKGTLERAGRCLAIAATSAR